MNKLLTPQQLCEHLGITKNQLDRLTAHREIPFYKINKKTFRYDIDEINVWLKERLITPEGYKHGWQVRTTA